MFYFVLQWYHITENKHSEFQKGDQDQSPFKTGICVYSKNMSLDKTDLNEEIYAFIKEYISTNGISPSFREIGDGCFVSQPTVVRYIDILEAQGRILRLSGVARSLRLVKKDD